MSDSRKFTDQELRIHALSAAYTVMQSPSFLFDKSVEGSFELKMDRVWQITQDNYAWITMGLLPTTPDHTQGEL